MRVLQQEELSQVSGGTLLGLLSLFCKPVCKPAPVTCAPAPCAPAPCKPVSECPVSEDPISEGPVCTPKPVCAPAPKSCFSLFSWCR